MTKLKAGSFAAAALVLGVAGCAERASRADSPAPSATVATVAAGAAPLRILPLGDSITQADRGHLGYRYRLWERLHAAGVEVDFVGSQRSHWNGSPSYPDASFDPDHEGHWGWRADELVAELPGWLAGYTADVVLLHAGTNDVFRGDPLATTIEELEHIVMLLTTSNRGVAILLARLIPTADDAVNLEIAALNAAIDRLPGRKPNVTVVDQFTGFDAARHTYDGVHPNEAGEQLMAERWLAAIVAVTSLESQPGPPVSDRGQ